MKIRTKSQLNTVLLASIVLMLSLTVFFSYHKMNRAVEQEKTIDHLNRGVFELSLMTHDYLMNHGTRALTQWQAKYDSLGTILSTEFQAPGEKLLMKEIRENYGKLKTIFSKLIITHQAWSNGGETSGALDDLQSRLMNHLMSRLQVMVSAGSQLAERSDRKLMSVQQGVSLIIMLVIVIFALIAVNSIMMGRNIVRSIRKLQKDIEIVGKGNLDHPLATAANDEHGELSRSFEQMARNLKTVMGSRDELENEVQERKKVELQLKESEEKYATFFHSNPQWLAVNALEDGRYMEVNEGFTEITGYEREEAVGRTPAELGLWPDPEERSRFVKLAREQGGFKKQEVTFINKDGETVSTLWSAATVEIMGTVYLLSAITDITGLKRVKEELKNSESRYYQMFETNRAVKLLIDPDNGNIVEANNAACSFYGYSREEITTKKITDINVLSEQEVFDEMNRARSENRMNFNFSHRLASGDVREVEVYSGPLKIGNKTRLYSIIHDVTERKKAEKAVKESEKKYRTLVEESKDAIYIDTREGKFIDVNEAMLDLFGYTREEMMEINKSELYADPARWSVIAGELERNRFIKDLEIKYRRKDGKEIECLLTATVWRSDDGKIQGYRGIIRDMTERRRLQDQLHKAKKMEAMGLMAGGIAHDLNNILSGIVSYPDLLLMDLPEDSPLRNPIQTMQESGIRAAEVVEDLLTIARGVASGREVMNLNTIVEAYLNSPEHQRLEKIHPLTTFKTELEPELLNMAGSGSHVKKVLMNLVANASEAIERKGTVSISTMNRYVDQPLKGYEDVRPGKYVVLAIADDGSGISPLDLDRIFEPFYTKKVMGRSGTGLGLAVVWNSMQDHDGYINVKSSENGTVFELYFPVTGEEEAGDKEEVPLEDYLGHGEKILVVDDEERQREIAGGILTRLGYSAQIASSGEEAIEYVKENPVDLIVLDMVMPKGINGRETYEEIIKIRPGQKTIIASGYAKSKEVDIAQELGAGQYIKKPYVLEKLGVAVREELEK